MNPFFEIAEATCRKSFSGRIKLAVIGAAAVAVLTGCINTSEMIYRKNFRDNYSHDQLMAFNGGKQMRMEIIGNPFSESDAEVAARLANAMYGRNDGQPIEFTADPDAGVFPHSRIVIMFSPPPSALGRSVCDGSVKDADAAPPQAGMEALMAFCWRADERSALRIRMDSVSGPDDPALAKMFGRATNLLLPWRNPFSGSETCAPNC